MGGWVCVGQGQAACCRQAAARGKTGSGSAGSSVRKSSHLARDSLLGVLLSCKFGKQGPRLTWFPGIVINAMVKP